jgi:hypothetical protein
MQEQPLVLQSRLRRTSDGFFGKLSYVFRM